MSNVDNANNTDNADNSNTVSQPVAARETTQVRVYVDTVPKIQRIQALEVLNNNERPSYAEIMDRAIDLVLAKSPA